MTQRQIDSAKFTQPGAKKAATVAKQFKNKSKSTTSPLVVKPKRKK